MHIRGIRVNKKKKKNRIVRVSDRLWDEYVKACEELGIVPSAYIRQQLGELVESHHKLRTRKEM